MKSYDSGVLGLATQGKRSKTDFNNLTLTFFKNANPTGAYAATSEFRYTVDTAFLNRQEREQYERDGFFVVKKLVPQADLDKYA